MKDSIQESIGYENSLNESEPIIICRNIPNKVNAGTQATVKSIEEVEYRTFKNPYNNNEVISLPISKVITTDNSNGKSIEFDMVITREDEKEYLKQKLGEI